MKLFINSGLWSKHRLKKFNRVRRFKKIHFFSEIFCADDKIVDPRMLTNSEGHSSREFSTERPTPSDLILWRTALKDLTSDTYTLQSPVGPFLQMPCTVTGWLISKDETRLYCQKPDNILDVYMKHGQIMRQQKFIKQGNTPALPNSQT